MGNTEIQERLRKKYGLEVTQSGSLIWTSAALISLCNSANDKPQKVRRSYKLRVPFVVYTVKLPSVMATWLREHDGASVIRSIVRALMVESENSVLPKGLYSPTESSQSSPLKKDCIRLSENTNVNALLEQLNSNECARCHMEFFRDEEGKEDETEYVPGLGLCHKQCEE